MSPEKLLSSKQDIGLDIICIARVILWGGSAVHTLFS